MLHVDIICTFRTPSEGSGNYYISIIIGHSGFGHACPFSTRQDILVEENVMLFIAWIQRKSLKKVQIVHTDGAEAFLTCAPVFRNILAVYKVQNLTLKMFQYAITSNSMKLYFLSKKT